MLSLFAIIFVFIATIHLPFKSWNFKSFRLPEWTSRVKRDWTTLVSEIVKSIGAAPFISPGDNRLNRVFTDFKQSGLLKVCFDKPEPHVDTTRDSRKQISGIRVAILGSFVNCFAGQLTEGGQH